jgi:hypothetical protein
MFCAQAIQVGDAGANVQYHEAVAHQAPVRPVRTASPAGVGMKRLSCNIACLVIEGVQPKSQNWLCDATSAPYRIAWAARIILGAWAAPRPGIVAL